MVRSSHGCLCSGNLRHKKSRTIIEDFVLDETHPEATSRGIKFLGELGDTRSSFSLINFLGNEHFALRGMAAEYLRYLDLDSSFHLIRNLALNEPVPYVTIRAVDTLKQLGQPLPVNTMQASPQKNYFNVRHILFIVGIMLLIILVRRKQWLVGANILLLFALFSWWAVTKHNSPNPPVLSIEWDDTLVQSDITGKFDAGSTLFSEVIHLVSPVFSGKKLVFQKTKVEIEGAYNQHRNQHDVIEFMQSLRTQTPKKR